MSKEELINYAKELGFLKVKKQWSKNLILNEIRECLVNCA
jgi:hypothetical protein